MKHVIEKINLCMAMAGKNHSIKRVTWKWGQAAIDSAIKEMKQLHDRLCMKPEHKRNLTQKEVTEVMESFSFLIEKERKQEIKARHVVNGSTQRPFVDRKEAASPQ